MFQKKYNQKLNDFEGCRLTYVPIYVKRNLSELPFAWLGKMKLCLTSHVVENFRFQSYETLFKSRSRHQQLQK